MSVRDLSEKQLSEDFKWIIDALNLELIGKEMRLGAFRFDAIAYDHSGALVIIELKVKATKDTLAQLLLYPHALRNFLKRNQSDQRVRTILVTTHVDSNVVDLVKRLESVEDICIKICTDSTEGKRTLVDPEFATDQVWDQSLNGPCNFRLVAGRLERRQ